MRGSEGSRKQRVCSSKLKVVAKDRFQVGVLQAVLLALQTAGSWRRGDSGGGEGGDECLKELALLLLDDLGHRLDHPAKRGHNSDYTCMIITPVIMLRWCLCDHKPLL